MNKKYVLRRIGIFLTIIIFYSCSKSLVSIPSWLIGEWNTNAADLNSNLNISFDESGFFYWYGLPDSSKQSDKYRVEIEQISVLENENNSFYFRFFSTQNEQIRAMFLSRNEKIMTPIVKMQVQNSSTQKILFLLDSPDRVEDFRKKTDFAFLYKQLDGIE